MTQPGTKPIPTATVDASAEDVRLYKRTAKLTLFRDGASYNLDNPTGIEITNLRFKFEVQRSLTSTPNSADVWIHNLSPRNRAELEGKNISVQVEAGYDGVNRLLCVGNVHFAMSEIQKTDWVTLLQLNDLGRAFTYGRVNRSYGAARRCARSSPTSPRRWGSASRRISRRTRAWTSASPPASPRTARRGSS